MPDWFVQLGLGAVLTIIGWLIVNKLNRIDSKLDRIETKQAQQDKDCVTWDEFNKLRADVTAHATEIAVIKTTCKAEHGK